MTDDSALLAAIEQAEDDNVHGRGCKLCQALAKMSDPAREAVERALAGTIGEQKLADILANAGYPTGRRAIQKHRREGHAS